MITYSQSSTPDTAYRISMIGIGGAGCNMIELVHLSSNASCDICAIDLDNRVLQASSAPQKINLGGKLTYGIGAGGDPLLGTQAVTENAQAVLDALNGKDIVILVSGLGGGTGSGVTHEIARMAKQNGCFVIAIIAMPFNFEGKRRMQQAHDSLAALTPHVDVLMRFDNDRVEQLVGMHQNAVKALEESNKVLAQAAESLTMLASNPGLFHIGFDDLKSTLSGAETQCLFGIGVAEGDNKAQQLAEKIAASPLFADQDLSSAHQLLIHISGGESMGLTDVETVVHQIAQLAPNHTHIHFGISCLPEMGETMQALLFAATGSKEPSQTQSINTTPALTPQIHIEQEEEEHLDTASIAQKEPDEDDLDHSDVDLAAIPDFPKTDIDVENATLYSDDDKEEDDEEDNDYTIVRNQEEEYVVEIEESPYAEEIPSSFDLNDADDEDDDIPVFSAPRQETPPSTPVKRERIVPFWEKEQTKHQPSTPSHPTQSDDDLSRYAPPTSRKQDSSARTEDQEMRYHQEELFTSSEPHRTSSRDQGDLFAGFTPFMDDDEDLDIPPAMRQK